MAQPFTYYYLSDLLKLRAQYEDEPRPFGRLYDIGAGKRAPYPIAVCLEFMTRNGPIVVPWSSVTELSSKGIRLRRDTVAPPPPDFRPRRDVLDDQVVDISGSQVRRVNDVHLLHAQGQLVVGHADVGILGILRRLGVQNVVCKLVRWLFDYTFKDKFVTWKNVEVISPGPLPGGLRLSVEDSRLADMHPAELADILESLGTRERQDLLNSLPVETAAEALEQTNPDVQRTVVSRAEPAAVADILEEMEPKEAADVSRDLGDADAQQIISRMESDAAEDVQELLDQDEESAGAVMSTACIEVPPEQKAADALSAVQAHAEDAEVLSTLHVLDEGRHLIGILSLRELLQAAMQAQIKDLMTTHLVTVSRDASLREVAELFAKYGFHSIPVVDENNVFLGAVRFKNVRGELAPHGK